MSVEGKGPGSPLAVEVSEGDPPEGWNEALLATGASPFHAVEWAQHKSYGGAGDPLYFVWRGAQDGEEAGRALAIRRPPRGTRVGRLASRAIFDSPPATAAGGGDFVSSLGTWAKGQPALLEVRLGSLDARSAWTPAAVPNPSPRREYLIPTESEDLWAGASSSAHRNIKRAKKAGLETRLGTADDARSFARLYRSTLERVQDDKGVSFSLEDESFGAALAPLLENGYGYLYLAGREGQVESGWLFIALGDTATAVYSGTTDEGRKAGGNSLSLYDGLCDLRERGFPRLNLGGASFSAPDPDSPDHGLHLFKTRFGAVCEDREGGAIELRPWRARLVDGARRVTGR